MRPSYQALSALFVAFVAVPLAAQDAPTLQLSLDEAVERTLKNNVDITVQRFAPESAKEGVREARGVYDPQLSSTISTTSSTSRARVVYEGVEKVETDQAVYNFGLSQAVPSGGRVDLAFNNGRMATNDASQIYNPLYSAGLQARLTQPLLRDLRTDSRRYQLQVAKKNRDISDAQFRQTVVNTVAAVKQGYYDLIYSIDNLEAKRKSLTLATKFLEENRIKVRVGTMAPLDVVQAEAEVASREEAVIVAEATLSQAEDDLKRRIFPRADAETWALRIVPIDRPTAELKQVDVDGAIRAALERRTDILTAKKNLELADAGLLFAKNNVLPALNLTVGYGASGTGGRQKLVDSDGNVTYLPGGYGDASSQVFGRDYPTWSIGATLAYPLFNRSASAAAARSRISREQTAASLRRLEFQVVTEVRAAARAVETNYKRVETTRAARVLGERRLDAEEKKFAAGMSTNYLVTQAQRDLAENEVAELRAMADYRKSLIDFDRVQEAGGSSISF